MTLDMNGKACPDCMLGPMWPMNDDDRVYCLSCGHICERYPDGKPEHDPYRDFGMSQPQYRDEKPKPDDDCGCDHSVGENCPECYAPSFDKPDICGETIVDKVTGLMEACPNLMPCKDHETLDRSADALSQVLQVCWWLVADLDRYELSEQTNNDENFNMHAHIGILRGRHMGLTNEMPKILDAAMKQLKDMKLTANDVVEHLRGSDYEYDEVVERLKRLSS